MGVKRTARKISLANLDRRHFSETVIYLQDEIFGVGLLINIDFREVYAAFLKELFGAAAIHTP